MISEQALILVVDDNEMNRDMLSRRLQRQGHQVEIAEDGVQALDMIAQHSYDLILLDIMMPRITGYEVLERVKNNPTTQYIPVIMISAVDDLESVVKCIEIGADDYLFKPFNPILLKARISASLEKKRLRDKEQDLLQKLQPDASLEGIKATVSTFFQAISRGKIDTTAIAGDYKLVDHFRKKQLGLTELQQELDQLFGMFPGFYITIREMIAEGNKVVTYLSVQPNNNLATTSQIILSQINDSKISTQEVFSNDGWLGINSYSPSNTPNLTE